uniref:Jacalin-type lectin domain-containing protein n=1 Tax=Cannabis sativa TaxID=3483 RepID=A0A803PV63_CANSA
MPTGPVKLFQGYSSATGSGQSSAVVGESRTDGVQCHVTYTICDGEKSVTNLIDLNQSVNFDTLIRLASVNEKLNFVKSLNIKEKDLLIVVHARKVEGKEVQTMATLASNISVPIANNLKDFFLHYGDSYVSSITRGGEYIGVYSFHSETKNETMKLELELKANGVFKFGSLDADFKSKLEKTLDSVESQVSFKQMMLGLDDVPLPKREDMVEFARTFSSQKLNAPKVLAFETMGYEHVVGSEFSCVALNRDMLVEVAEKLDKDPITPLITIPELPSLSNGMPQIKYKSYYSQDYGRRYDEAYPIPFNLFTTVDEYIKNKTRITGIQMRTVKAEIQIQCITVDFESTTGRRTEMYGKDIGNLSKKLVFEDGDFIKKIYTRYDSYLHRLGIFIDENRSIIAGGGDNETEHTFNVPDGCFILGFSGFSSAVITQIQIIYAEFQPAKWSQLI